MMPFGGRRMPDVRRAPSAERRAPSAERRAPKSGGYIRGRYGSGGFHPPAPCVAPTGLFLFFPAYPGLPPRAGVASPAVRALEKSRNRIPGPRTPDLPLLPLPPRALRLLHDLLDLLRFDRHIGEEVARAAAAAGDDDVVLQADAEILFRDVDAGLDGQHIAGDEGTVAAAEVGHAQSPVVAAAGPGPSPARWSAGRGRAARR